MMYLDISVKDFSGRFTQKAKGFGVQVKILQKVPKWDLTVVRLLGTNFQITEFLKAMMIISFPHWTWETLAMHANAIKLATPEMENPVAWKNRALKENRDDAV